MTAARVGQGFSTTAHVGQGFRLRATLRRTAVVLAEAVSPANAAACGRGVSCGARARESRWRVPAAAATMVIGGASSVLACPVCFGAEESSMIDGTKIGVLVLLAITLVVQGGFAGFFFYLRRRAKRNAEIDLEAEWSELQRASRTS